MNGVTMPHAVANQNNPGFSAISHSNDAYDKE
jgi:hypothetical protein